MVLSGYFKNKDLNLRILSSKYHQKYKPKLETSKLSYPVDNSAQLKTKVVFFLFFEKTGPENTESLIFFWPQLLIKLYGVLGPI